jgi:Thioesterase-like superfamily
VIAGALAARRGRSGPTLQPTEIMTTHPFDQALKLEPAGSEQPDRWRGATSPAYWNMVGPFGGSTAATALQSVLQHPLRLGEPVSLTVNYASATAEGEFDISATPVRTNRSTLGNE